MTAYSIDFRRPLVLLSATLILSQARPTVRMHLMSYPRNGPVQPCLRRAQHSRRMLPAVHCKCEP